MLRHGMLILARSAPGVALCADVKPPSVEEVKSACQKATDYLTSFSTEGGYLWLYSSDLSERWGENKATPTQIWVQPPGTPGEGMAFLDAYAATGA
jgi:hypothetical protein